MKAAVLTMIVCSLLVAMKAAVLTMIVCSNKIPANDNHECHVNAQTMHTILMGSLYLLLSHTQSEITI